MLHEIIHERRIELNISLSELARASGHSISTVQGIDNGRNQNPSFKTICDISDCLKIPIADLKQSLY